LGGWRGGETRHLFFSWIVTGSKVTVAAAVRLRVMRSLRGCGCPGAFRRPLRWPARKGRT